MILSLVAITALIVLCLCMRRFLVIRDFDLVDLLLAVFFLTFIFRPFVLILRLDDPLLSDSIDIVDLDSVIFNAVAVVFLWMLVLSLGVKLGHLIRGRPWMMDTNSAFTIKEMNLAAFILFVLGSVLIVPEIIRFGGFAGLAFESKLGEGVDRINRYPAIVGGIWAAASIVSFRRHRLVENIDFSVRKTDIVIACLLFVGNGTLAFSYGARDVFVFGVVAISLAVVSLSLIHI